MLSLRISVPTVLLFLFLPSLRACFHWLFLSVSRLCCGRVSFLDRSGCVSLRQQPGAVFSSEVDFLASVKLFPDHGGQVVIVAHARRQGGTVATLRKGDA